MSISAGMCFSNNSAVAYVVYAPIAISSPWAMLITPIRPNTIARPERHQHQDGEQAQAVEGLHGEDFGGHGYVTRRFSVTRDCDESVLPKADLVVQDCGTRLRRSGPRPPRLSAGGRGMLADYRTQNFGNGFGSISGDS